MTATIAAVQQKIRFSKESLEILKNFASINNCQGFEPGQQLRVMSASESIGAIATLTETIPIEFSIYEMNRFLGVLSLQSLADADLVFEDNKKVVIESKHTKVNYFFSSQKIIDPNAGKTPVYPRVDFVTTLDAATLDGLEKAAATLGHKFLKIVAKDGKGKLIATSPEIDTSNDYIIELDEAYAHPQLPTPDMVNKRFYDDSQRVALPDGEYTLKFENIRIIPGTYKLMVSSGSMVGFEHLERPVQYFVALEQTV